MKVGIICRNCKKKTLSRKKRKCPKCRQRFPLRIKWIIDINIGEITHNLDIEDELIDILAKDIESQFMKKV